MVKMMITMILGMLKKKTENMFYQTFQVFHWCTHHIHAWGIAQREVFVCRRVLSLVHHSLHGISRLHSLIDTVFVCTREREKAWPRKVSYLTVSISFERYRASVICEDWFGGRGGINSRERECSLVAYCLSNILVYLRDRATQITVWAAILVKVAEQICCLT